MRNAMAVVIGFLTIFSSVIITAIAIRSMQDFANHTSFFQTDVQAQIQDMTLMMLVPIAFGIAMILYGAWPQKETPVSTEPMIRREVQQVIEKEVVVVKIRCTYCNTLYDATLDRCPYCGATR